MRQGVILWQKFCLANSELALYERIWSVGKTQRAKGPKVNVRRDAFSSTSVSCRITVVLEKETSPWPDPCESPGS